MQYQKPELTEWLALDTIQNPLDKQVLRILDSQQELSSVAAYAADE